MSTPATDEGLPPRASAPGDELLPGASMVFDRERLILASAEQLWPWLLQLGKQRAGWYLPARVERWLPAARRASRTIDPRWQTLVVGDRIPDYGGRDGYLEVSHIRPPHALVYRSERGAARFTWALLREPHPSTGTVLRLRFRGQIRSTGWRRRAIVTIGDWFDWATGELMLRGLAERAEPVDAVDLPSG